MEKTLENILKEADILYDEGKFFEACFSYKEAIEKIQGKKVIKEIKDHIKNRLKYCIKNSSNSFQELNTQIQLDEKMINDIDNINVNILKSIGNELDRVISNQNVNIFICSHKSNEETSIKTLPITYQICNIANFSEDGYLYGNSEDFDPLILWGFENYKIGQSLKSKFHINPVFKKIVEGNIFTDDSFAELIKNKGLNGLFDDFYILKRGVNLYLKKEYIEALHIIIPQLENLLLLVCENEGIQTTVIERGKTTTKRITFSDRDLQGEELIGLFGDDYCLYLRYVLYSPLGLRLRHKVAHGTVEKADCNETNINLVIIALLILINKITKVS